MHSGKLTKIIATIGPACEDENTIKELIIAGVNIFRFNTKHNTNDWHKEKIILVKKVSDSLNIPVGIFVDLQGPEIRIETYEGKSIQLEKGENIVFVSSFDNMPSGFETSKSIRITEEEVIKALNPGDSFSIDDGFIDFEVVSCHPNYFIAICKESVELKTRKGLNLVGIDVNLPSLTKTDKERLSMASEIGADFIGLSFVRTRSDIKDLRYEMEKHKLDAKIIAKIESQKGVDNISEIIEEADGIMVARGDLGVEVPLERVTHIQKDLIRRCRDANKPVIVATQMLQSMIDSPRPTRAEAADVANAIYDETDALMLSGETAFGKYPLKAVETMKKIARYNEQHIHLSTYKPHILSETHLIIDSAMILINYKGNVINIDKVVVLTETGQSVRVLSSFRPRVQIIAVSNDPKNVGNLTMSYGVLPVLMDIERADLIYPSNVLERLEKLACISKGQTLLVIHGHKYKQPGTTNAMVIVKV